MQTSTLRITQGGANELVCRRSTKKYEESTKEHREALLILEVKVEREKQRISILIMNLGTVYFDYHSKGTE